MTAIDDLKKQRKVLQDCGLDKEARRLDGIIRDKEKELIAKKGEAREQRERLVRVMLLCFAAGDIATLCADALAETFDMLTYSWERKGGHELADIFREQAQEWNRCVQIVDGDGEHGDERVSMYYADMAEDMADRVLPVMRQVINEYMATPKGKRLF